MSIKCNNDGELPCKRKNNKGYSESGSFEQFFQLYHVLTFGLCSSHYFHYNS